MTHVPYIAGAYGLAVALMLWLGVGAWIRTGQARRRLAAVDTRPRR